MIEGHGDDIYAYGEAIRHNFSSNILSGVDHEGLIRHLARCKDALGCYPEPVPASLEEMLGKRLGVSAANLMATNGATEAIYLIAHAFAGAKSMIASPSFREYEDACALYKHDIEFMEGSTYRFMLAGAPCMKVSAGDGFPGGCVWLCNPNNPNGRTINVNVLRRIIALNPDRLFVVDQAYADYTSVQVLTTDDAVRNGNLLILGSFTKRYSVPGLRVGYAIGDERVMKRIKSFRMPWAVSGLAIEGAKYLLEHEEDYPIDKRKLHCEALRLTCELKKVGIGVYDTDCNFILCHLPKGSAAELKAWLMERYGILIRDASNFRGLTKRHFRVAAQREDENDLLISALREWMEQ